MDRSDDVLTAEPKRPNFPEEYRRAIVEMTLKPGASTSRIAREHGLNVNMVFKWRQRFKKELIANDMPTLVPAIAESAQLLPVSVIDTPLPPAQAATVPASAAGCEIEVETGKRRVFIRGVSQEFAERFLRDCLK
ncbi:IS66-like element accessory protein TnpA [Burkholderia sp. AU4i]|uniref:IS66-like element accessory protein TnpA n=1 Tax=Burkholderia sp. AU4i TaxID=1335308 RepID=UPI0005B43ADE|nr:transposase [Burkholderia sp. AU4i]